ncbi:hypothetical protein Daus18300_000408 [Diaporthe australafricana]|uniref:Heterokaryon incompatibility domain-containing protein n=1 Tax=Diaporthe australafricana TaxID=127596 RepID=A0ABR3Y5W8_9PEZI
MAAPYEYTPFLPGADQIRLLTLLPASEQNGGEIVITLHTSPTEAAARQYEALSYVWGSPDNPETISVATPSTPGAQEDDVSSSACNAACLDVTQNLAIALRHLRRQDAACTLWIDAICINQQNTAERSEQVGKMAQIYSSAARVVVWLGPASPDSDLAMRLVSHLGQVLRFNLVDGKFTSISNVATESHWGNPYQELPYEEAELRALEELFSRPWFDRLWVVQEVLASLETVVICGRQKITWQYVMVAVSCIVRKVTKTPFSEKFGHHLVQIEEVFDTSNDRTILNMVVRTRELKCTDDRDRIYALLSLAKDVSDIKPDYSLSAIQVYQDLVVLLVSNRDLRFLPDCNLGSRRLAGPSWVPDWTAQMMTRRIWGVRAATLARQAVLGSPEEGCSQVTAIRVGTIVDVDVVSISSPTSDLILREINRLVPADIESSTYKNGCRLMEAFSGTLVCSSFDSRVPHSYQAATMQKSVDALRACLRWDNGVSFDHTLYNRSYLGRVYDMTKNRAVVRTEEGYVGLAPSDAKQGDTILAILSCNTFTVVRPAPGDEGRYNVVGESFVYGLGNGEAILGPLPDYVRAEDHYNPDLRGWCPAYRDTRTGGSSFIDPRLEALGIPNEINADGVPLFVSGDALEKAGIRLSQVELV